MPISGSRLNLLMNLTGTSNGELGKALSFDTSYISRIRAGKRGIPRHQPFLEPASFFFAEKLSGDNTLKSVAAFLISPDTPWPADLETAAGRIAGWLRFDLGDGSGVVEEFLRVFCTVPLPSREPIEETLPLPDTETTSFLGKEGKRRAMELLVNDMVTHADQYGQLLFYTDEDLTWLMEDCDYYGRWKKLGVNYLLNGGKICLIHTANRELSEVFTEMEFYMPFYLCGNVEPYYCPVLLDGIFRRTLCILCGRRALAGHSVGEDTARSTSLLLTHPDTLRTMEYNYRRFLGMCRPIMRILNPELPGDLDTLSDFFQCRCDLFHLGNTPMLGTLPESALRSMEQRSGGAISTKQVRACTASLVDKLEAGTSVTEILNLPDVQSVRDGLVPLRYAAPLGCPNLTYTPAELRTQLIQVIRLLEQYPNYHVALGTGLPENLDMVVKEESTLLTRLDSGGKSFFFPSNRAVSAMWKYMVELAGRDNRESAIPALNEVIFSLGNSGNTAAGKTHHS